MSGLELSSVLLGLSVKRQEDNPRYKTAEGHCTWCPQDRSCAIASSSMHHIGPLRSCLQDSCLGDTVVTLGAGRT